MKNESNPISDNLNKIDEVLANLEDFMHGKDGADITHARKLIEQTITELNMPLTKEVSITDDKPFDREGAIKIGEYAIRNLRDQDYGKDVVRRCVDALIESGHLSSHLKEGEQRNPLTFEEFCKEHCGLTKGTTVHDGMVKAWQNAYKYYLIGFKQ